MNIDQQLDAKQNRRLVSQDRFIKQLEKREIKALAMIGELCNGKFYVYPQGGKYKEGDKCELIAYLIRNKYV
ncbi:hypothetical protein EB077_14615 [bacterium]|nr:hypothetical protein [bacterium]NDG19377.1 hypothetical protein [Betaproteobacteria bacterium]